MNKLAATTPPAIAPPFGEFLELDVGMVSPDNDTVVVVTVIWVLEWSVIATVLVIVVVVVAALPVVIPVPVT